MNNKKKWEIEQRKSEDREKGREGERGRGGREEGTEERECLTNLFANVSDFPLDISDVLLSFRNAILIGKDDQLVTLVVKGFQLLGHLRSKPLCTTKII